ncbi:lupus La protein-like [Tropilaelaps mercedesae]|uniref:Lupus La protein-like n=1 Tax=Tropilaelaps mercedesae TaxID=418985 RepID=A0A1V9Y355_9ACAR|nr:lupus La protein-like [Tropilaelaps mercedesae]
MTNGVEAEKQDVKLSPEQLREKIIYQVEFYFGDYNLPKDKFLLQKIEENEGWIEMDTLLTFNRLKSLTTDKDVISNALKASDHGIVEVSEDNLKIRRNPSKPLPESFKQAFIDRTVYVKGFPKDTSLDQLIDFFRPHGSGCVKMRRFSFNRQFKGSVFVLMESEEAAKKLRSTEGLKYLDQELILMMAQEHADKKATEKKESGKKRKSDESGDNNENDELKEMARVEEMFQKMDKKPGVFLLLTGFPKQSEVTFQDIKTIFVEAGFKVGFVEFEKGKEEAMIRFEEDNGAKLAAEKLVKDGKFKVKDIALDAKVLEGDEETTQYRKQAELKAIRFQNDRSNRKRAGQHREQGYRGRGVKRNRGARGQREDRRNNSGGNDTVEPDEKRAKTAQPSDTTSTSSTSGTDTAKAHLASADDCKPTNSASPASQTASTD